MKKAFYNCSFIYKVILFAFCIFIIYNQKSESQTGHWEKLNPQHHPGFRNSHGMAQIGKNKVILFGGAGDTFLNDTWIFDLKKNDWEKIDCKNQPTPRAGFGMCQITEKQVLLFGGSDNGILATYNDLWIFNLDSMDWKELKPEGYNDKFYPLPTYRPGMAKLTDSSIVIYGGEILDTTHPTKTYTYDTWVYNINQNRWDYRIMQYPSERSDHMMVDIDNDLILMIGGWHFGYNEDLKNNWIYITNNYFWKKILDIKINLPNISASAISGLGYGIAVLFGGETNTMSIPNSWYDTTWVFNYNLKTWTKLELNFHPSDRLRPRMARIDSNKALLFGGASQTNKRAEDTWLFVLDSTPNSVTVLDINEKTISTRQVSNNEIIIEYFTDKQEYINFKIFNLQGSLIFEDYSEISSIGKNKKLIQFPILSSGIYFIRIKSRNNYLFDKFIFTNY